MNRKEKKREIRWLGGMGTLGILRSIFTNVRWGNGGLEKGSQKGEEGQLQGEHKKLTLPHAVDLAVRSREGMGRNVSLPRPALTLEGI